MGIGTQLSETETAHIAEKKVKIAGPGQPPCSGRDPWPQNAAQHPSTAPLHPSTASQDSIPTSQQSIPAQHPGIPAQPQLLRLKHDKARLCY